MFFVIIEVMFYINVKHKKTHKELMLFCYSSSLVITIVLLFSFLLGPITAVQYLYYLNGHLPNNYLEYGTIFYLIPRVCVESVKAPAECALTATVLYIVEPNIKMIHNNTLNKWPSVNK